MINIESYDNLIQVILFQIYLIIIRLSKKNHSKNWQTKLYN